MELNREPEQLTFKAFELAEKVAALIRNEADKKEANDEYNGRIKILKKQIAKLSAEIEGERARVS